MAHLTSGIGVDISCLFLYLVLNYLFQPRMNTKKNSLTTEDTEITEKRDGIFCLSGDDDKQKVLGLRRRADSAKLEKKNFC